MENKDNLDRSSSDLFSTASVRAAQGWNKIPLRGKPASTASAVLGKGRSRHVQTAGTLPQQGQQLGLRLGSSSRVVGMPISGSVAQNLGMAGGLAGQNLLKTEEEVLQEKIFAARMMGAPVTVGNNIATASNFSLNVAGGQSLYNADTTLNLAQQQQQQQTTLLPAQQAQAKMIAAALFNTIKPVLPTLSTPALTPQQQLQQQQLQLQQLQQQQIQLQQLQQKQQQQQQQEKQPLDILKQLIKPLERKQLPKQVKPQQQQQRSPLAVGSTGTRNVAGQARPKKWSNTRTSQSSNLKVDGGKLVASAIQKLIQKQTTSGAPVIYPQGGMGVPNTMPSRVSPAVNVAAEMPLPSMSVQSAGVGGLQQQMGATKPFLSTKVDSTRSFEVLQSLKDDGYIDSPKSLRSKSGSAAEFPNSDMEYISTIWPTTLDEDWKNDGSGDQRPMSGVKKSTRDKSQDGDRKRQEKKSFKKPPPSYHSYAKKRSLKRKTKPSVVKPLSPWHASVDAFLKSTKQAGKEDTKSKSPALFPSTSSAGISFLSEADTDETISSINRRVEMLKMQKEQILQDEMEEFQREINALEDESGKMKMAQKRSMSLDRDEERSGPRERERGSSRDSTGDRNRERDRGRYRRLIDDRDRDRDRRRVSRSPPKKRSPRARSQGEKKGDNKSPSPKRSRGVSQEKSSSKSEARTIKDRQGRYPSKVQATRSGSSERRTSRSPDRKRKKSEGEPGEMFIDGRWQKPSSGKLLEKKTADQNNDSKKSETRKSERAKPTTEGKSDEVFVDGRWQKRSEKTRGDRHSSGGATDKHNADGKTPEATKNQTPGKPQEKKKEDVASSKATSGDAISKLKKAEIHSTTSSLTESKEKQDKDKTSKQPEKGKKEGISGKEKMQGDSGIKDKAISVSKPGMSAVAPGAAITTTLSETGKGISASDKMSHSRETPKDKTPRAVSTPTSFSTSKVVDYKKSITGAVQTSTPLSAVKASGPSTHPTIASASTSGQSTSQDKQQLEESKKNQGKPVSEDQPKAAVGGVDSSLIEEIKDSSIPHQMGLLRALSIQQYVADKVMVDWFCYVCGCLCHSMKVYTTHINGTKHQTLFKRLLDASSGPIKNHLISKLKLLPEKKVLEAAAGKDSSMTAKAALLAGLSRRPTCNRCLRTYTGSLQEHLRTEEHKKYEGIRPRCTDCNLVFKKIEEYRKHLCDVHQAKVAASPKPSTSEETVKVDSNVSSADAATSKSPTAQKANVIGSEFITPISGFFCKLCSKFYNNEKTAREVHCATGLHITKTRQYYASRNQSPGASLRASLGVSQQTETMMPITSAAWSSMTSKVSSTSTTASVLKPQNLDATKDGEQQHTVASGLAQVVETPTKGTTTYALNKRPKIDAKSEKSTCKDKTTPEEAVPMEATPSLSVASSLKHPLKKATSVGISSAKTQRGIKIVAPEECLPANATTTDHQPVSSSQITKLKEAVPMYTTTSSTKPSLIVTVKKTYTAKETLVNTTLIPPQKLSITPAFVTYHKTISTETIKPPEKSSMTKAPSTDVQHSDAKSNSKRTVTKESKEVMPMDSSEPPKPTSKEAASLHVHSDANLGLKVSTPKISTIVDPVQIASSPVIKARTPQEVTVHTEIKSTSEPASFKMLTSMEVLPLDSAPSASVGATQESKKATVQSDLFAESKKDTPPEGDTGTVSQPTSTSELKEDSPKKVTFYSVPFRKSSKTSDSKEVEVKKSSSQVAALKEVAPVRVSPRRTRSSAFVKEDIPLKVSKASPLKRQSTDTRKMVKLPEETSSEDIPSKISSKNTTTENVALKEVSTKDTNPKETSEISEISSSNDVASKIQPKDTTSEGAKLKDASTGKTKPKETPSQNNESTSKKISSSNVRPKEVVHKASSENATFRIAIEKETSKDSVFKEIKSNEPSSTKETMSKEASFKDTPSSDKTSKEGSSKDAAPRLTESTEAIPLKSSSKDVLTKESTPKKNASKNLGSEGLPKEMAKEASFKETASEQVASQKTTLKEKSAKDVAPRETKSTEAIPLKSLAKNVLSKDAESKKDHPQERVKWVSMKVTTEQAASQKTTLKEKSAKDVAPRETKSTEAIPLKSLAKNVLSKDAESKKDHPQERVKGVSMKETTEQAAPQKTTLKEKSAEQLESKIGTPQTAKGALSKETASKQATPQKTPINEKSKEALASHAKAIASQGITSERTKETTPRRGTPKRDAVKDASSKDVVKPQSPVQKVEPSKATPVKPQGASSKEAISQDITPSLSSKGKSQEVSSNITPKQHEAAAAKLKANFSKVISSAAITTKDVTSKTPAPTERTQKKDAQTRETNPKQVRKQSTSSLKSGSQMSPSPVSAAPSSSVSQRTTQAGKVESEGGVKEKASIHTSSQQREQITPAKRNVTNPGNKSAPTDASRKVNAPKMPVSDLTGSKEKDRKETNITSTEGGSRSMKPNVVKPADISVRKEIEKPAKVSPKISKPDQDPKASSSKTSYEKEPTIPRRAEDDFEEFIGVEDMMSGDIIILDDDSDEDMDASFEEEHFIIDSVGDVSGDLSGDEELLEDDWIMEDVEGEVEDIEFEMGEMFAIDEVVGSDDEDDDGVLEQDVHQVEEWEVLSEAEDD